MAAKEMILLFKSSRVSSPTHLVVCHETLELLKSRIISFAAMEPCTVAARGDIRYGSVESVNE
jgi:hypothetical protein